MLGFKLRFVRTALIMLMALILPATGSAANQRSVTDLVGRRLQVPTDPRRVVALAPSITEIIFGLNRQNRLAGVTKFSDHPPAAKTLPKVGSYVYLDVERIAALQPDLCIGVKDGNPVAAVEKLAYLNIPVFAVNPHDLNSVMQSVAAIGDLLGAGDRARRITGDMQMRIDRVRRQIEKIRHRPRVFFQIGVSPIVSVGSNTFIDQLISLAGGTNAAEGPIPYPRYSREQVIAMAPEIIIITSMSREAVFERLKAQWMQWSTIPAVQNGAVYLLPSNLTDRPTPRLVDALELLARKIHPELYEEHP